MALVYSISSFERISPYLKRALKKSLSLSNYSRQKRSIEKNLIIIWYLEIPQQKSYYKFLLGGMINSSAEIQPHCLSAEFCT